MIEKNRLENSYFSEVAKNFLPFDKHRLDFFKNEINPRINTTKPMMQVAAGYDLGPILGSQVEKATAIDQIYSQRTDLNNFGILPLIDQIINLDKNACIEVSGFRKGPLEGRFDFVYQEKRTELRASSHNELVHKEDQIYSVYASIGHDVPQLFLPQCKAEIYALSHISPEAWGYRDIVMPFRSKEGLSVAAGFEPIGLTDREMSILTELNLWRPIKLSRSIDRDQLNHLFSGLIENKSIRSGSLEEVIGNYWRARFSRLKLLNNLSRNAYIKDVSSYISDVFGNLPHDDQRYTGGQIMLQKLEEAC